MQGNAIEVDMYLITTGITYQVVIGIFLLKPEYDIHISCALMTFALQLSSASRHASTSSYKGIRDPVSATGLCSTHES